MPRIIQDSPFSDYFSEGEVHLGDDKSPSYTLPSPEAQRLLLRLNDLGSQILREEPSERAVDVLNDRLDALEDALTAPEAQSRQPAELVDSGLFMGEDEQTEDGYGLGLDGAEDFVEDKLQMSRGPPQFQLVKESQALLDRVTRANIDLRSRFDEMRQLNDEHITQLEETTREVLQLRSETESLKSDLGFDHSELLFLKLQLKALEVQADGLRDAHMDTDTEQAKRVLLLDDFEKWKSDWDDVDARLRGRREKHNVLSATPTKLIGREDGKASDEAGDWKLDTCKKRHGRVQSITIKRLSLLGLDGTTDDDDVFATSPAQADEEADVEEDLLSETDDLEEVQKTYAVKTPWQDLWQEIAYLAGVKEP